MTLHFQNHANLQYIQIAKYQPITNQVGLFIYVVLNSKKYEVNRSDHHREFYQVKKRKKINYLKRLVDGSGLIILIL